MTCTVFGPGLVGSFLGAAAGCREVVVGSSGRPRAHRVRFGNAVFPWMPEHVALADLSPAVPVLVATRVHRTPWAALPGTTLAAQNGLGQPCAVATCFFAVDIDADGVLHATGPRPRLVIGHLAPCWRPTITAWREAGITVDEVADPLPARWEKTILNATVGPLCLVTGLGMAAVWADPDLRELTMAATHEGIAVALADGVRCCSTLPHQATAFFSAVGDHRPSVVTDPGELPWVLGHLLRQAERHDLAVPALTQIAARVAVTVGGAMRSVATRT